jgi:hypothetical protein
VNVKVLQSFQVHQILNKFNRICLLFNSIWNPVQGKYKDYSNCIILNRTSLHWHEIHVEYLRVSSGKTFITVDEITSIVNSNSDEICIPIGVVRENDNEEDLIIWERIETIDSKKEFSFWNRFHL